MGLMEEWDFKSAADYAAFGAPDFPDVHREWVRRESLSDTQALINQHGPSGRMAVPRLYDYGGVGHCGLFPNIPYEVCGEEYEQMAPSTIVPTPTSVVIGAEDQTQSQTSEPTEVQEQAETVHQEPAAQTPAPAPAAPLALKVWGAVTGIAIIGIVLAALI